MLSCQNVGLFAVYRSLAAWRPAREQEPGPNVIFTEPPTGAATPYLGAGAVPGGSICGLAAARPAPPTAPAPSSPRSGIREKGISDGGQQAARAGRSVACRRGADPKRDKDQPEMSERKHGGDG
jgi:hypothetical protein